ncbi:hypothetical protein F8S09_01115 [Deinococcus sp. SDU3-2]|uniref:Vancomycin resistance protein n=1 Tax=Deinococcus terrestris TaxID=2651870 RepID=A0A7X1NT35_9DEIO|nr:VanW family protein [Deinococcus terrestris]MPY65296.1 hypothetical protein [Deinococcus terrestris]
MTPPFILRRGAGRLALLAGALLLTAGQAPPVSPGVDRELRPQPLRLKVVAPEPVLSGGVVRSRDVVQTHTLTLSAQERRRLREGQVTGDLAVRLEGLYARIEARQPRDARFVREGGSWVAQARTGWAVRRGPTAERVRAALLAGQVEATVALRLLPPERTVAGLHSRGVTTHLTTGQSSFAGSPDFRVHNIRVGAQRFQGLWLEPGTVLDFNRTVGRIAADRGFVPGYVITGASLTMEPGGGICQVSTTVFRAGYQAGLEVVERHQHSHHVAYYDPPGFEATVYAPTKNLRLRNDTAAPLLMQVEWNLEAGTLEVHLFGAPPDREVTVSAPQVRTTALAPAPSFVADPALRPGEARRLDMPAAGMNTQIVRRITRRGQTTTDRTSSQYRAWGGMFAVAPGDERLR